MTQDNSWVEPSRLRWRRVHLNDIKLTDVTAIKPFDSSMYALILEEWLWNGLKFTWIPVRIEE